MRKILFALIGCFAVFCAHAAQVVNVDYVHKLITQKWDISVPIKTNNIMAVANMKYLLTAVDVANEILNGEKTTDYGNTEFATTQVADTVATIQAVDTLVRKEIEYKFFLTTTPDTSSFNFDISAAGEFIVNWGDGKTETITKPDTTNTTYSHTYSTSKSYTIKLTGQATVYNTSTSTATISFYVNSSETKIASIDGSLGAIFGTLADGTQPRFYMTFLGASNMKGSIPSDLFAGISGAPAKYMFAYTFEGCSGLTGAIPDGLFGNLTGAPADSMFNGTFWGCNKLTSIPENLFGNISGTAQSGMFYRTFYNCTSLTGPSARINGQYLYEIWPDATSVQVGGMYRSATGLDDYRCIPTRWGGGGENCSAPTAEFTLTTTPDTNSFEFSISAAGEFVVDWGDGTVETITKPDTTKTTYSHNYDTAGAYTIGLSGQATAYNTDVLSSFMGNKYTLAAISFSSSAEKIASIDGSLGAIFGTLTDGTQPRFYETFYNATNMTGSIPSDLFAGISGAPAEGMFNSTFSGCSGLTGAIPDGLFAGISGTPASSMFTSTFHGCSGLTGAIPDGLFGNLSGAPAEWMFFGTFQDCRGLTSIPENLFGNISGTAQNYMFSQTFYNCTSLTGPSARINGQYLYEIWPDATSDQVGGMYSDATKLDDYRCIPTVWGGGGDYCGASAPEDTEYKFFLTTTPDTTSFSFNITAAGEFVVDWGDGTVETITKPDTTNTPYSHNYDTANTYTIGLSGQATAYSSGRCTWSYCDYTSISFSNNTNLHAVSGSLGEIFGILSDGTMANFSHSFYNCNNLISISDNLFKDGNGQITSDNFMSTFWGCRNLMAIPETLLGNDSSIFTRNSSIGYAFEAMFKGCDALTGPSARINGQYLYEIWADARYNTWGPYCNASGLSDYSTMPSAWKYCD